jgi:hypothetical protein
MEVWSVPRTPRPNKAVIVYSKSQIHYTDLPQLPRPRVAPTGLARFAKRRAWGCTAMSKRWNRREILKGVFAASAAMAVAPANAYGSDNDVEAPVRPIEVQLTSLSPHTFRLSLMPVKNGSVAAIPMDGSLVEDSWGVPAQN